MTLELNEIFGQALPSREVEKATESAERAYLSKDKEYNYKNTTLIELLDISEEEQTQLKTIISTEEKYKRNNDRRKAERRTKQGLTKREQEKQEKIKKVKELKEQGFKQREIAEKLGISIPMVKKYYAEIKKV